MDGTEASPLVGAELPLLFLSDRCRSRIHPAWKTDFLSIFCKRRENVLAEDHCFCLLFQRSAEMLSSLKEISVCDTQMPQCCRRRTHSSSTSARTSFFGSSPPKVICRRAHIASRALFRMFLSLSPRTSLSSASSISRASSAPTVASIGRSLKAIEFGPRADAPGASGLRGPGVTTVFVDEFDGSV